MRMYRFLCIVCLLFFAFCFLLFASAVFVQIFSVPDVDLLFRYFDKSYFSFRYTNIPLSFCFCTNNLSERAYFFMLSLCPLLDACFLLKALRMFVYIFPYFVFATLPHHVHSYVSLCALILTLCILH